MSTVIWDDYLEKLIESWRKEGEPSRTVSYLNRLRANALSRIESLRLPTIRDEEWRFTDISSLRNTLFPRASTASLPGLDSQKSTFLDEPTCRLVFVDGQYMPGLSGLTDDGSIIVCSLSELTGICASKTEQYLGQLADFQDDVFVADRKSVV